MVWRSTLLVLSGTPVVSWVVCVCAEVDRLIGQVAEIASACPESLAAVMGRRRRAAGTRTGRGRTFIARRSGRSRGAGTRRWTAFSIARRRRTTNARHFKFVDYTSIFTYYDTRHKTQASRNNKQTNQETPHKKPSTREPAETRETAAIPQQRTQDTSTK